MAHLLQKSLLYNSKKFMLPLWKERYMATQRISEPQMAVRPIAFAICATGLLIFLIGAGVAVVLARAPQPLYVFILPGAMAAVGLFYALRALFYLIKR
jgi:hypothetical protein